MSSVSALFILCFMFITTTNLASALLSSDDPVDEVNVIVVGKIISATPNYDVVETKYVAEIEEIVKGWNLLEEGNNTKSIQFNSPGIQDYVVNSGPVYKKIFQIGDRALLMLNQRGDGLYESLWSRVTTSDCSGSEIARLYYAPAGLYLSQQGHDIPPFYTNEPITAKFYYFNKELSNKTINIKFEVFYDWPNVAHTKNAILSLERCQPFAEASTAFVMPKSGTFAISATVGNNDEGSQSFSGIKVIDYVLSPLKQFESGTPVKEIQCKEEFVLVFKTSNEEPACLTPETKQILIERGWAKPV